MKRLSPVGIWLFAAALAIWVVGCGSPGEQKAATGSSAGLAKDKGIVIDVRTPEEYARGHITGSTNVPVGEIADRIAEVVPDKSTPVYVHCQSGQRSSTATELLKEKGYSVHNLGSYENAKAFAEKR